MTGCRHHWRIADQDGSEFLPGRCRLCGAERLFRAALLEVSAEEWEKRDRGKRRKSAKEFALPN